MECIGVAECVMSKFAWFIPSEPYLAFIDEFGKKHVADRCGDLFPVDDDFSSHHAPHNYQFRML